MSRSRRSVLVVFSRHSLGDFPEPPPQKAEMKSQAEAVKKLPAVALRLRKKGASEKVESQLGVEKKLERGRGARARHLAERRLVAGKEADKVLRALTAHKMRISSIAFSNVEKMTSADMRRERCRLATISRGAKYGTDAVYRARKARQLALQTSQERCVIRQQEALFARHKYLEQRGQRLRLRRAENRQHSLERLRSNRARLQQKLERSAERRAAALAKRARQARVSAQRGREALSRFEARAKALAARINRAQNRASLKRFTAVAARRLLGVAKRTAFQSRWMERVGDLTARIEREARMYGVRREGKIWEKREKGRALGTVRVAEAVARTITQAILRQAVAGHSQTRAASHRLCLTSARVSTASRLGSVRCQLVADRNSAAKKAAVARFVGKLVDASARRLAHRRAAAARAASMGAAAVVKARERVALKMQQMWVLLDARLQTAAARRAGTIAHIRARPQTSKTRSKRADVARARLHAAAAFRLQAKLENARARRAEVLARGVERAHKNERRRSWARGFAQLRKDALRTRMERRLRRAVERRATFMAARPRRFGGLRGALVGKRVEDVEQRLMRAAMNRAQHVARIKETARHAAKPLVRLNPANLTQNGATWEAKQERAQMLRDACAQRSRRAFAEANERRTRVKLAKVGLAVELANKIKADMRAAAAKRDAFLRARRASADRKEAAAAAAALQLRAQRAAEKARALQENAAKRRHVSLEATRSKAGKSVARHVDVVNQQRVRLVELKNGILERQDRRVSEGVKRREELMVARKVRAHESAAFSLRAVSAR